MTKDELNALLDGQELTQAVDVKTIVMDIVKDMDERELLEIFWEKLPEFSAEFVEDYLYMKRS